MYFAVRGDAKANITAIAGKIKNLYVFHKYI